MSRAIKDYNSIKWGDLFVYDETSKPTCLRWKEDRMAGKLMQIFAARKGATAGSLHTDMKKNYSSCTVPHNGTNWFVGRVIWIMHNGSLPADLVIDHVDGDTSNNKISNLRAVNQVLNNRNAARRKDNATGVPGVTFTTTDNGKYTYVTSSWYAEPNKSTCKHFSVLKLGLMPAFAAACAHREMKMKELNANGSGYTERHIEKGANK